MKAFVGELIGTFVLTLFGCGSVVVAVLFGEYGSIFQIALVWGIGVTLAIYLTRHLSCAHLNPAVTVAMVLSKRMKADKLLSYLLAQFAGAFLAGAVLYGLLAPTISAYELAEKYGVKMQQIALAWEWARGVTSPIVGATKTQYLDDAAGALAVRLTAEDVAYLEEPYLPHRIVGAIDRNPADGVVLLDEKK